MQREENYVSVVVVTHNDEQHVVSWIKELGDLLKETFRAHEFVVVDNFSTDRTVELLRAMDAGLTLVRLSKRYSGQVALSAGVDASVGDYVFEIEDLRVPFAKEDLLRLYKECQSGKDFVFLSPKSGRVASRLYYFVLNRLLSGSTNTLVPPSVATISSRRGINKMSSLGRHIVNRNVAAVLTGLQVGRVKIPLNHRNRRGFSQNFRLLVDTFIYYTSAVANITVATALLFLTSTLASAAYAVVAFFVQKTADGWASLFFLISAGFFGLFLILAILTKYLDHILRESADVQSYSFINIEKR